MRHHKAITEYPVFLVALTAIVSIMILSSHILATMASQKENPAETWQNMVKYRVYMGRIYLETNAKPPIYTAAYPGNNTNPTPIPLVNNHIYGPLKIPEKAKIIILYSTGGRGPEILDILRVFRGPQYMHVAYRQIPPSAIIDLGNNIVIPVDQVNGKYTYLRLSPLTIVQNQTISQGAIYSYDPAGNPTVIGRCKYVFIGRNTTQDANITGIMGGNTEKYGEARLNLTIPLKIYPENQYTMPYQLYLVTNTSSTPEIILLKNIELGSIEGSGIRTLWVKIKSWITSINVVDNKGRQYRGDTTIIEKIEAIDENNNARTIYYREENIGTNTSAENTIAVKTWINNTVNIVLQVKMVINTHLYIVGRTLMASATIQTYPDLKGNIYAETFIPDTITFTTTNNTEHHIIPSYNQTVNLTIKAEKTWTNYNVSINQTPMQTVETITYTPVKPETINYTVEAKPSNIIIHPPNIIIQVDTGIIKYNTSIGEAVYYSQANTMIAVTITPAIQLNNTVIPQPENTTIHVIKASGETILYTGREIIQAENTTIKPYNYIIKEKTTYTHPVIIIDNRLGLKIIRTTLLLPGNKTLETDRSSQITVPNTIIVEADLTIENIPGNTTIVESLNGQIITVSGGNTIIDQGSESITIGGEKYLYIAIADKGILLPLNNTFTTPTTI